MKVKNKDVSCGVYWSVASFGGLVAEIMVSAPRQNLLSLWSEQRSDIQNLGWNWFLSSSLPNIKGNNWIIDQD